MDTSVTSGLFALLGAVVGGLFTYFGAKAGHDWAKAKADIVRLCDQVAAYHKLEELYKEDLAKADPVRGKPKTLMEGMRESVQELPGFVRPNMSANEARKLKDRWS